MLAVHLKEVPDRFDLTKGHLFRIITEIASSNYLITCKLQFTNVTSGIDRPTMMNPKPDMAHVMQIALCAFRICLSVNSHIKSWKTSECNSQFGENETTDIGTSVRLRKEGNARINKLCAISPGLAKMIKKECISRYFEHSETDLIIAANACCVEYTDTWSSTGVHWLSKRKCTNYSTTHYGCGNAV